MPNLLLHSLSEFRELIFELFDAAVPQHVVEVGAETGAFTEQLVAWAERHGARLTTIDPLPDAPVRALAEAHPAVHRLVLERTPGALDHVEAGNAYLLDGDHNYWTVSHELAAIHAKTREAGVAPMLIMHDVGWPWARRDLYYSPSDLPAEAVHPHTFDRGVHLDHKQTIEGGFRGNGAFAAANEEGGDKNGVLTAVEDFLGKTPGYDFYLVPAVFGLGVVVSREHPHREAIAALLRHYHRDPLLARLEENRLRNYLQVIALQDAMAATARAHEAALLVEKQRGEATLAAGETKWAAEKAALETHIRELNGRIAQLEGRWYHRYGARIDETVKSITGSPTNGASGR